MINYENAWNELKQWVKKEQEDMLTNPDRIQMYESGISCQTMYIKDKMNELEHQGVN